MINFYKTSCSQIDIFVKMIVKLFKNIMSESEIINVLQAVKTPSLTIYFRNEYTKDVQKITQFQQTLEHVILKNLTIKTLFSYDPDPYKTIFKKDRLMVENFFEIPDENYDIPFLGTWLLTLHLQKEEFIEKKLSCEELIEKLKKKIKPLGLLIVNSNENYNILCIRIKIFWPNILPEAIPKKKNENVTEIFPIYENQYLKRLNHFMINFNLKNTGSAKIKKAFIREIDSSFLNFKNGFLEDKKEFVLDTEGVDLRYILNYNGLDHTRCFSNDILESFKVLGIEAVRRILILELRNLISFDGSYVNSRHLFLLVDTMTHRGKLMSITRHGINKTEIGPIAKCSFEETIEVLYHAAAFGVCDNLKGISAGVLVGQLPCLGTGKIDLFLSEKKLSK
jgi:DNA-directed RNA polymerase II subunit RPB1